VVWYASEGCWIAGGLGITTGSRLCVLATVGVFVRGHGGEDELGARAEFGWRPGRARDEAAQRGLDGRVREQDLLDGVWIMQIRLVARSACRDLCFDDIRKGGGECLQVVRKVNGCGEGVALEREAGVPRGVDAVPPGAPRAEHGVRCAQVVCVVGAELAQQSTQVGVTVHGGGVCVLYTIMGLRLGAR
jgi:hypothetical protein